jgi:hypothetical protein
LGFVDAAHVVPGGPERVAIGRDVKNRKFFPKRSNGRVYAGPDDGYAFRTSYVISRFAVSLNLN